MAKFVLHNVRLFAAGADLTTYTNQVEMTAEAEEQDATSFTPTGQVWKESLAGLRTTTVTGSGQWDAGDLSKPDDTSFANLGGIVPVTVCPATAADGALAWMSGYLRQSFALGGGIGDVAPWSGSWSGNWPLARGVVLHSPAARTATGTGTGVQIVGGVPANGFLVGTLHVMSASGTTPSITVTVQSDDTNAFGSPTTRLSFNAQTTAGGQVFRVAGPITDTWFRVNYTISGTTPSLLFMTAVGVAT